MRYNYFKYYKKDFVIPFVIILGAIIGLLTGILLPKINHLLGEPYMQFPSNVVILGIVLFLIDKYWWKTKAFSWLFWIKNFSGKYTGKLNYSYRDEEGETKTGSLEHVKIISQTGSKIVVSSFTLKPDGTKSSLSESKGVYVEKTDDENHYKLIYTYLNEGSVEQGFPPHYGTEVVKVVDNDGNKMLEGGYYTNRQPFQTRGEFSELKWVNNSKEHEF